MSTFDGTVPEFPNIRIDRFNRTGSVRVVLANFLSHVHSDHLVGLETCSSFVYCSMATREIVLRLEKRYHRINFANGRLEVRKRDYAKLKLLLKPLPLETPIDIELAPGDNIRVTLFDANHCIGAVMFLIEGNGKAILYTGDIRSEAWWVDTLTRHPVLLPYVCSSNGSSLKTIDTIYLDTTFASKADPYRNFPSKADGTRELLEKLSKYPSDTIYYFDSWTFGYEDVYQAMASFLNTRIHVDQYKYGLYFALTKSKELRAVEAAKLISTYCGNHLQVGCLTADATQARIHSCEAGTGCDILDQNFVRITPIISRHNGRDMAELGAGGGYGDTDQNRVELETIDSAVIAQLMDLCKRKLAKCPEIAQMVVQMLSNISGTSSTPMVLERDDYDNKLPDDLDAKDLLNVLMRKAQREQSKQSVAEQAGASSLTINNLPSRIRFPYSRHSSYNELCLLIKAFKPKDIFPCTVNEKGWTMAHSMSFMFGHLYDTPLLCRHDRYMLSRGPIACKAPKRTHSDDSQGVDTHTTDPNTKERISTEERSREVGPIPLEVSPATDLIRKRVKVVEQVLSISDEYHSAPEKFDPSSKIRASSAPTTELPPDTRILNCTADVRNIHAPLKQTVEVAHVSSRPESASASCFEPVIDDNSQTSHDPVSVESALRSEAYKAAAGIDASWFDINLISLGNHSDSDREL